MNHPDDPTVTIPSSGSSIPSLAFGLYKVPADDDGVSIIIEAIKVRNAVSLMHLICVLLCTNIFDQQLFSRHLSKISANMHCVSPQHRLDTDTLTQPLSMAMNTPLEKLSNLVGYHEINSSSYQRYGMMHKSKVVRQSERVFCKVSRR